MEQQRRTQREYSIFLDNTTTAGEVLAAARYFVGVPYSDRGRMVQRTPNGWLGAMNCLTFFLHVARRVGYLPHDTDIHSFGKLYPRQPIDELYTGFLTANLDQASQPGSGQLLYLYPQHSAIYAAGPLLGTVIHASKSAGRVVEVEADAALLGRVSSVWSLRGMA